MDRGATATEILMGVRWQAVIQRDLGRSLMKIETMSVRVKRRNRKSRRCHR